MPIKSEQQRKFMAMCLHSPEKAEGKCPPKSVAKKFIHGHKRKDEMTTLTKKQYDRLLLKSLFEGYLDDQFSDESEPTALEEGFFPDWLKKPFINFKRGFQRGWISARTPEEQEKVQQKRLARTAAYRNAKAEAARKKQKAADDEAIARNLKKEPTTGGGVYGSETRSPEDYQPAATSDSWMEHENTEVNTKKLRKIFESILLGRQYMTKNRNANGVPVNAAGEEITPADYTNYVMALHHHTSNFWAGAPEGFIPQRDTPTGTRSPHSKETLEELKKQLGISDEEHYSHLADMHGMHGEAAYRSGNHRLAGYHFVMEKHFDKASQTGVRPNPVGDYEG